MISNRSGKMKVSSIVKFLIALMMLINLGYFKLLPVWAEMFSTYSSNLTLANLALIVVTVGITLITYRIHV